MNKPQDQIRNEVAEAYARAVEKPAESSGCSAPVQKGMVVKLAGYRRTELDALPPEAVVNSFGCGNPMAFSEVREGDVVLDLGSGAGIDILIAARKVGATGRAIGIDMTDEMIAKANENIAASGLNNVEVRKGIIEALPVESASVDWVISNCVINLSPDKQRVFSEIARVLRPGGRMLISDIVVEELPEALRQNEAVYCSCVGGAISEAAYVEGLGRAGLESVEVRERLVYDVGQLAALFESELDGLDAGAACCGRPFSKKRVNEVAGSLAGKVWSATFAARKPGV